MKFLESSITKYQTKQTFSIPFPTFYNTYKIEEEKEYEDNLNKFFN